MKKLFVILFAVAILAGCHQPEAVAGLFNDNTDLAYDFQFDAPYLVQVTENNFIGFEGRYEDSEDSSDDELIGSIKWTYDGTLVKNLIGE